MKILAIETATYFGGIAFGNNGQWTDAGPFGSRTASREILAAIDEMLGKGGCDPGDLDLVAVSTGPGLFTGVRVGLSIAKTLAWAAGGKKPALVGVSTLEVLASMGIGIAKSIKAGSLILTATDARRGEIYAAIFEVGSEKSPTRLSEDLVLRPERLKEKLAPSSQAPIYLIGDGFERYPNIACEQFPEATVLDYRAGKIAVEIGRMGEKMFQVGRLDDPRDLNPHYVRRPDARPSSISFLSTNSND